ncbi:hypothetical protein COCVIDRAFT_114822 [Bipolaris victoriae FI3]|uniref:SnoaL-like domain-containing protein n=1 Tax=Bipolaris victoriae (strain FI3) TaxID=930091 RepID=W7E249_BIPV3|nr:hypothetical protein COCVIDRAFT_114822 [Bipolaris victoriae FI3]
MADADQTPLPLPATSLTRLAPGVILSQPLSRKGSGPGLIVIVNESGATDDTTLRIENGVPSPLMKWGEESYTVVELLEEAFFEGKDPISLAVSELSKAERCEPKNAIGVIAYDLKLWNRAAPYLTSHSSIVGAVVYANAAEHHKLAITSVPVLQHMAGKMRKPPRTETRVVHDYPNAKSYLFATPFQPEFDYNMESVSHTRNLSFLKPRMNGPWFDLEAIWDEHQYWEFEDRSVPKTMATMVQEPYVNHVPTLTGGIGREALTDFYTNHFVYSNPKDVVTELISRSMGIDRVIDEFIFKCTHDAPLDWLIPGIPPTGRKLEIPFTAVVNIRGDRLYHEHIAWDQGTVLAQLGLLPEYLPIPYALPSGQNQDGNKLEYKLPVAGIETARKMQNKDAVTSNVLLSFQVRNKNA